LASSKFSSKRLTRFKLVSGFKQVQQQKANLLQANFSLKRENSREPQIFWLSTDLSELQRKDQTRSSEFLASSKFNKIRYMWQSSSGQRGIFKQRA